MDFKSKRISRKDLLTEVDPTRRARLLFFTDPLCAVSYSISSSLRKLIEQKGQYFGIEYKMGGLMPLWEMYRNAGISSFDEMTAHWTAISHKYGTSIDGSVWLIDPPHSSFPPSIAYKAAQIQDTNKAQYFYERLLQMVFVENINISHWKNLQRAAEESCLDVAQLNYDWGRRAKALFEEDLQLTEKMGVSGFPTFVLLNRDGKKIVLEGYRTYDELESFLIMHLDIL